MRFLCDVHIPISLSKHLSRAGHESTHVNRLPTRWHTSDKEIARLADQDDRILDQRAVAKALWRVGDKDSDFRDSCLVKGTPRKLIKVNLGNLAHQELSRLLLANLQELERLNERERFLVEVDKGRLSIIDLEP